MDDSEQAGRALQYAFDNHPDAAVTVLHVVGSPSMMMGEATSLALEKDLEEAAKERAEPVFERARKIAAERDRDIETKVGLGHPARNIIEEGESVDAIILGSHGSDRSRVARRFLLGNITDTVVRRASVPVTVVR